MILANNGRRHQQQQDGLHWHSKLSSSSVAVLHIHVERVSVLYKKHEIADMDGKL